MALGKNIKSASAASPDKGSTAPENQETKKELTEKSIPVGSNWVESVESFHREQTELEDASEKAVAAIMHAVVKIGREQYAMPIDLIKEVIKTPKLAYLPQAPEYVLGLGNVRGTVMAIVDLNRRLNADKMPESSSEDEDKFIIVLNHDEIKAGLVINRVPDTIAVDPNTISTSTSAINGLSKDDGFIKGIIKHDSNMIILIDPIEMVSELENM